MLLDIHMHMPNQDPLGQDKLNFSARSVKKWAKKLSVIDLDQTAEEYLQFIQQSNRNTCPSKQRLSAIDALQPLAKTLLDHLRKYLVSQSLPLSDKAIHSFTLQQEICSEIAIAYKIIIQDMTNEETNLDYKKITRCIHHAIEYSLHQYVACLQMYERPQKNIWPDCCQLYRLAEQLEITDTKIASDIHSGKKRTIENLFKHYCGLGPISSIQLRHGEMEKLNAFIETNCDAIVITRNKLAEDMPHLFWIDLRLGRRPRICALSEITESTDNRFIDYQGLVEKLAESAREAERSQSYYVTSPGKLRPDLARRFQQMFEIPPKRQHERIKSDKILHAVIGWTQIQTILSCESREEVYKSSPTDTGILESLSLEPMHRSATRTNHHASRNAVSASALIADENLWDPQSSSIIKQSYHVPEIKPDPTLPVSTYAWRVSNFSEGGCCLHHCGELSCKTHVGDLIALQDRSNEHTRKRWSIGVIRWIQGLSAIEHKIGVQLLSNSSSTVEIDCEDGYHQSGILLKQNIEPVQYSLLCPPGISIQQVEAKLHSSTKYASVRLGDIIEKTSSFIHVELEEITLDTNS